MREPILLLVLAFAFLTLLAVFAARVARPRAMGGLADIFGGVLGMLFWGVAGLGALGVETFNPATGETVTYSEPALAWVSAGLVIINLVIMLDGTHRLVDFVPVERGMQKMDDIEEG